MHSLTGPLQYQAQEVACQLRDEGNAMEWIHPEYAGLAAAMTTAHIAMGGEGERPPRGSRTGEPTPEQH
ncbi:hypothetical protein GCM10010211_74280 [Streptomyces albospinus]|uniref:Uncharacterized protein n=1 Tax=Streptomyces albospinus TaxID=285515 RepID=A0ABQ2VN33_9ACTN|nr:hypothetical protein GCM10010211_74280 [Streptomyces albospinus]